MLFLVLADVIPSPNPGGDMWLQYGALGLLGLFIIIVFTKMWEFGQTLLEHLGGLSKAIQDATAKFTSEMVTSAKEREGTSDKLDVIHEKVERTDQRTGRIMDILEARK